jgi:acetolactate decarboxylase
MRVCRLGRLVVLALLLSGSALWADAGRPAEAASPEEDTLFQTSTLSALMVGLLGGVVPISDLAGQGDLGLGTLEGLDGELLCVDGVFYQVSASGAVREVAPDEMAPFAMVTHFEPDIAVEVPDGTDLPGLTALLDATRPSDNAFYAVRIEGAFRAMKTRSVPRQEPYAGLMAAVAEQSVFELGATRGTLVGFWFPAFVAGLNLPGYHFHFVTDDRAAGGHVLGLTTDEVSAALDVTPILHLALPGTSEFLEADLSQAGSAAKAEK